MFVYFVCFNQIFYIYRDMSSSLPNLNISADEIINETNLIIKSSKKINDEIANLKILTRIDVDKLMELISDDINKFQIFHSLCSFLQYISPDEKIRNASFIADLTLSKYINELNLRKDIYDQLLIVKKYKHLDNIDIKFLDKLILNYERNGILLLEEKRQLLLKIKHEISKLENVIGKYISKNEAETISLSISEVKGLPNHILSTFELHNESSSSIYKIQLNKNIYNVLMKYIDNSEVRRKIETVYSDRFKPVASYICKLIVLKDKYAKILSYSSYSDYKAQIQMVKNSENIKNFLVELLQKLDNRYINEIETINKIAKKYESSSINSWDLQYYITKWKKEYGINESLLKEYFELNNTVNQIFKLYETMFNIKFKRVKASSVLWHKTVTTYCIIDSETNKNLGFLYLDLHARDGKYKQTRCFSLHAACMYPYSKKTYQLPIIALISSLSHNLLNFQDVISLFHELGHVMHHIFGKTKYIILSGTNVEDDFVQSPAQILDLLCWEKNIIKQLSCHYKTKQPIPDEIINKIIKLKNLDLAIHYKKHICISLFDQIMYSSGDFINSCETILKNNNTDDNLIELLSNVYHRLHNQIMVINNEIKLNLNPDIYLPIEWIYSLYNDDPQYYSSIWSRVLSSDMYNEKIKNKSITSNIGNELKKCILQHGGTLQAYDMICNYLKRKPEIDGFISMHNLDTDMEYSFYLKTDQIKTPIDIIRSKSQLNDNIQLKYKEKESIDNNKNNNDNDTNDEEFSNRFSEINESSINFEDYE